MQAPTDHPWTAAGGRTGYFVRLFVIQDTQRPFLGPGLDFFVVVRRGL